MNQLKWTLPFILFISLYSTHTFAQNTCHEDDSIAMYDLRDGLGLQATFPGHIATWGVGNYIDTITDPANPNRFRVSNIFFDALVPQANVVTLRDSIFWENRLTYVENFVIDNNFIDAMEPGGLRPDATGPTHLLKQIDISYNDFPRNTQFFTQLMANLGNLEVFIANTAILGPASPLTSFPMDPLPNLYHLDIQGNLFSGTLNLEALGDLSQYPSLMYLYADNNEFVALNPPTSMVNFAPMFEKLRIDNNKLLDFKPIETCLVNINSLVWLYANNAMDTASIQDLMEFNVPHLLNLRVLDLSHNLLTGELPLDLFEKLDSIEILYINGNLLTGALPIPTSTISGGPFSQPQAAYGGTHYLIDLDISDNLLGGKLQVGWLLGGQIKNSFISNGFTIPLENFYAHSNRFNEVRPRLIDNGINQVLGAAFNLRFFALKKVEVYNNAFDFKDLFILRKIFRFQQIGNDYVPNGGSLASDFLYAPQSDIGIGGLRRQRAGKTITIAAGAGIMAPQNPTDTNYISNTYTWERVDTAQIVGGTPASPITQIIAIARQVGGSLISSLDFNNGIGVSSSITSYVVGVDTTTSNLHKLAITALDTVDHGNWLYRATVTNDSFPNLTLKSRLKKVEVGGCRDDSGAEVWCQSMIIQFHPDTLAQYPPEKHDSLKQAIRESMGAEPIDACLCGDIELWAISDTAMLEAFGKGTRESSFKASAKPELLSADPNYNLLASTSNSLPDTVSLPSGSGNQTATTLVAIIDSGIDYEYSALTPFISEGPSNADTCMQDAVWGFNFVDKNPNATDDHGHGTAVAGIVAGLSNQSILPYVAGTSPDIGILPLKYTNKQGKGSLFNAACAMRYAADYRRTTTGGQTAKVKVINNSWGYYGDPCIVLENVIEYVGNDCGILVVCAAGNNGSIVEGNDSLRHWPSNSIWDPMDIIQPDNILSVAGTGSNPDFLDGDSNWGSVHIDIAAPWHENSTQAGSGSGFVPVEGTSFATPQVARAAALLFDKYPDATYWAVRFALIHGVDILQSDDSTKVFSGGRINFNKADSILNILTDRTLCDSNITINIDQIETIADYISIYPNPVSDLLMVEMDYMLDAEDIKISLFNVQGLEIQHQEFPVGTTHASISTKDLPTGIYFVKIQLDNKQYSAKIVKL